MIKKINMPIDWRWKMDLTEFTEKVLGVELKDYQKKLIEKWEPAMKALHETKIKYCDNCAEKQLGLCRGITLNYRFGISGCSEAIAVYSEALHIVIDNKSDDFNI